jgi:hypothetical protein
MDRLCSRKTVHPLSKVKAKAKASRGSTSFSQKLIFSSLQGHFFFDQQVFMSRSRTEEEVESKPKVHFEGRSNELI